MRPLAIGGTGGIGRAFALALAKSGAQVTVVGQTFRDAAVPGVQFLKADLSLMTTALRIAKTLPVEDMDVVLFTTGIMAGPLRKTTAEGIEQDLAISYLNRFVMQGEIAPRLGRNRSGRPRIVNVAFPGSGQKANLADLNSEQAYARWKAHSNTVAGNVGLVLQGAQDFPSVDFFGLNPGFVKTGIRGNLFGSKTGLAVMEWLTEGMQNPGSSPPPRSLSAQWRHYRRRGRTLAADRHRRVSRSHPTASDSCSYLRVASNTPSRLFEVERVVNRKHRRAAGPEVVVDVEGKVAMGRNDRF